MVEEDSPAGRVGIREGDLLVSVAGAEMNTADDLYAVLETIEEGSSVPAVILRANEMIELTVEF